MVLANDRERYIRGLGRFREGALGAWIEQFSAAGAEASELATGYLNEVRRLMDEWRRWLGDHSNPRSDAAAWALIETLPAYPVITAPIAAAATGRAKAAIHQAIMQLGECGVLEPISASKRNRSWEASGLLELLEGLEAGRPASAL